jgi:glutathione S-transferase
MIVVIFADKQDKEHAVEALKETLSAWLGFINKRMLRYDWIHVAGTKPTIADFCVAHFYFNLAHNAETDV